jgi:hypothetical protein
MQFLRVERVFFVVLNCVFLLFDTLKLVLFADCVDAEPTRQGGGIGVQVVYEDGAAEWQDLDDY